jgi:hypothetical protein
MLGSECDPSLNGMIPDILDNSQKMRWVLREDFGLRVHRRKARTSQEAMGAATLRQVNPPMTYPVISLRYLAPRDRPHSSRKSPSGKVFPHPVRQDGHQLSRHHQDASESRRAVPSGSVSCPLAFSELRMKEASVCWPLSIMVRKGGFEPPRSCERQPLKLVRLPVPPLPLGGIDWSISAKADADFRRPGPTSRIRCACSTSLCDPT